jgi:hypothetical protein
MLLLTEPTLGDWNGDSKIQRLECWIGWLGRCRSTSLNFSKFRDVASGRPSLCRGGGKKHPLNKTVVSAPAVRSARVVRRGRDRAAKPIRRNPAAVLLSGCLIGLS